MKLLGLSGSPTERSKTLVAVEKAVEYAEEFYPSISTETINVRDYDVQFCDGRDTSLYEGDTKLIIDKVIEADALIIGSPMYRATYTGMLKNVFDLIPNDALYGKPVGLIATGGSYHHFLAIEHALKPVIGFFQAYALPTDEHYSDGVLVDEEILDGLRWLATAIVEFRNQIPDHIEGAFGPSIPRKTL